MNSNDCSILSMTGSDSALQLKKTHHIIWRQSLIRAVWSVDIKLEMSTYGVWTRAFVWCLASVLSKLVWLGGYPIIASTSIWVIPRIFLVSMSITCSNKQLFALSLPNPMTTYGTPASNEMESSSLQKRNRPEEGTGTPLKEPVQSTLTEMLQSAWARENSIKESKSKKLP